MTDFDSYLASDPTHTSAANGTEWFSQDYPHASQNRISRKVGKNHTFRNASKNLASLNAGRNYISGKAGQKGPHGKASKKPKNSISGLTVTYGFSELTAIDSFVLWNEEFAGIGTTQLLSSVDGITYTLLSTIAPAPSTFAPTGKIIPYVAQVLSLDLTSMLFFRLLISDCPGQPSFRGCGIGEVAFSALPRGQQEIPPVPLPAALPLLASALGFFVWFGWRRKNYN